MKFITFKSNKDNKILYKDVYKLDCGVKGTSNPLIFACSNGYLDLNKCEFINILTSDVNDLNCGYEFPIDFKSDDAIQKIKEMKDLLKCIYPDEEIFISYGLDWWKNRGIKPEK